MTPLALRGVPDNWTLPAEWPRLTEDDGTSTCDADVAYTLDLTEHSLSAQPYHRQGVDEAVKDEMLGEIFSWRDVERGVVPARLTLGILHLRFAPELAKGSVINGLLADVSELAQRIVDEAVPVPGRGLPDWSPRAVDAGWAAGHMINRRPYRGTEYDYPHLAGYYVPAAEVYERWPDLADPDWATCSDADLPDLLTQIHNRLGLGGLNTDAPEVARALLDIARRQGVPNQGECRGIYLVGHRAWLHEYRRQQAGGLDPIDIRAWDGAAVHAHRIEDSSTDEELQSITQRAIKDAESQGIWLLGTTDWAVGLRSRRREEIQDSLRSLATEIAETEQKLNPLKKRRRALTTRALAWSDPALTDSALGRLAGLSHTTVRTLRETLEAPDETDD